MNNYAYAFWQQEDHKQVIATPFQIYQSKMLKIRRIMSCNSIGKHFSYISEVNKQSKHILSLENQNFRQSPIADALFGKKSTMHQNYDASFLP